MEINFYWFAIKEILFKIKQAVFLSGPAPVKQQESPSGLGREFLFSIVAVRGTNLSRSVFSAESGNILSQLSCSQRFVFSNESQKVSSSRMSSSFSRKPKETHNWSWTSIKLPFSQNIFNIIILSLYQIFLQKCFLGPGYGKNVKERCNKNCSKTTKSFS